MRRPRRLRREFRYRLCDAVVGDEQTDGTSVLDILGSLAAKSLLTISDKVPKGLFHLPHTSRAYAFEKLRNSDESDVIHRKYIELHHNLSANLDE